jgi:hypothetical protein
MDYTQGEVNDTEVQVPKPSVLDDLLGVRSTLMDVDPSSVNGETELNAYMRVQQFMCVCLLARLIEIRDRSLALLTRCSHGEVYSQSFRRSVPGLEIYTQVAVPRGSGSQGGLLKEGACSHPWRIGVRLS